MTHDSRRLRERLTKLFSGDVVSRIIIPADIQRNENRIPRSVHRVPPTSVIPYIHEIVFSWIIRYSPSDKLDDASPISHVDIAHVLNDRRSHLLVIVILRDEKPLC